MIATDNVLHPRGQTADDYVRELLSELGGNAVQPGMVSHDCRRIIDGKTYNSKIATFLATASRDAEDFKWYLEKFFRTRNGAFSSSARAWREFHGVTGADCGAMPAVDTVFCL